MSGDGFVRIYRRVTENPVFRDDVEAMAFVWMVMRAAWQPADVRYKGAIVSLDRGQLAISIRDLGERFRGTKDWAKRFLDRLADRDMIATESATGVNVITICNYDKYQWSNEEPATAPRQQARQHRDSAATQNKEGKEGKEDISEAKASSISRPSRTDAFPCPDGVDPTHWRDFRANRRTRHLKDTPTAHAGILREISKFTDAEWPPGRIVQFAAERGWGGIYDPRKSGNDNGYRNGSGGSPAKSDGFANALREVGSRQTFWPDPDDHSRGAGNSALDRVRHG